MRNLCGISFVLMSHPIIGVARAYNESAVTLLICRYGVCCITCFISTSISCVDGLGMVWPLALAGGPSITSMVSWSASGNKKWARDPDLVGASRSSWPAVYDTLKSPVSVWPALQPSGPYARLPKSSFIIALVGGLSNWMRTIGWTLARLVS